MVLTAIRKLHRQSKGKIEALLGAPLDIRHAKASKAA
jgi:hypothetical protein